jgi:DNA adenine methylase
MMIRSPLRWFFGGKGSMQQKIIPLMPPCKVYVEPMGGGASILLARDPVDLEVYNDLNDGLYAFFTVLSDPTKFDQFYRRVQPLLFSRKFYIECRDTWKTEPDPVLKAVKFFVAARQAFSGKIGTGWGYEIRTANKNVMAWMNTIDGLPELHNRLRRVQVQNEDWNKVIDLYDGPDCCFYCDPPYVHETRVNKNVYEHEMTADDHRRFIDRILNIQGMAVVSGYIHPIYEPLEKSGWNRHDFDVPCNPSKTIGIPKNKRVESVWVKPYTSTKTHDRKFI